MLHSLWIAECGILAHKIRGDAPRAGVTTRHDASRKATQTLRIGGRARPKAILTAMNSSATLSAQPPAAQALSALLTGVNVLEMHADPATLITHVTLDSRRATPGSLFIAVTGFATDGHRFIGAARANGASVCICERPPEVDIPYVLVADSRAAEPLIAAAFYGHPAAAMTMIGVTGTNGKTTSTLLIKHILESVPGNKVGLVGTISNMIGATEIPTERTTPDAIELQALLAQMRDAGCTHVVMEVSSHSLVLHRVGGIHFALGAFTNLTEDHLDFHKTMANYAAAKAILFEQLSAAAVINADDEWASYMAAHSAGPVVRYSATDPHADYFASDVAVTAKGVRYLLHHESETAAVTLAIPAYFSVYNSLVAIACCAELGVPLAQCAHALASATGVRGRVEVVPGTSDYTMIIDYAHTPDAIEKVLASMREVTDGRLVALFGAGGDRDPMKRPLMGQAGAAGADFLIITSDNPRTEDPEAIIADILPGVRDSGTPYVVIPDRIAAIHYAMDHHLPGDVIVLAGKGHETYQEINHVKHHLDEREVIAAHLAQ